MIEKFSWLHVSDLHLKADLDVWAQNVVLRELVEDVRLRAQRKEFVKPEFIIASGDLAFSGIESEYRHVENFLDELAKVPGLPRERVFCVPGNHDVNRNLQKTCHKGALHLLSSPQAVDEFLGDRAEREMLLQRQSAFRTFEQNYSRSLSRTITSEGFGYVAQFDIEGLLVCLVALNSAWLCKGDDADERNILVGERQFINALEILKKFSPRLVIGVTHHPTDWLRSFDKAAFENRLVPVCDFLHRGHLHEPDIKIVSTLAGHHCVVVGAGTAFMSRDFENSYSLVSLNLKEAVCQVNTFVYLSKKGGFQALEPQAIEIQLRGSLPGSISELAQTISDVVPTAGRISYYLAALLLGKAGEVPIQFPTQIIFASPTLLKESSDNETANITMEFLSLKNLLRAFSDDTLLAHRVAQFKDQISNYAELLLKKSCTNSSLLKELEERENQFNTLARTPIQAEYLHTRTLMKSLMQDRDWKLLESIARRNSNVPDRELAHESRRMLAVSLANADEPQKHEQAAEILTNLAHDPLGSAEDIVLGTTVFQNLGRDEEAKTLLLYGLGRHPKDLEKLSHVGRKLATAIGDQELRRALDEAARSKRSTR